VPKIVGCPAFLRQKTSFLPSYVFSKCAWFENKVTRVAFGRSSTFKPYDIIIFVEIWLSDDVLDAELGFLNYNLFRLNRNLDTSVHFRSGGVLISVLIVKNSLLNDELRLSVYCVEQIFIDIHIDYKQSHYRYCLYFIHFWH